MGVLFPSWFCLEDCCENHSKSNEFNRLWAQVRLEVKKTDFQRR